MPADVPEGNYRITLKIASQGRVDSMTRDLKVKKGLAMGPDINRETAFAVFSIRQEFRSGRAGREVC